MTEPGLPELPAAIQLAYLAAAVAFIVGLKRLSSPATARSGNQIAAAGMGIAVLATLFVPGLQNVGLIIGSLVASGALAGYGARVVRITDMPQVVALLNGLGGGAAALVSVAESLRASRVGMTPDPTAGISIAFGVLIGALSFSGSMVAFGKLQGWAERPVVWAGQQGVNLLLLALAVVLSVVLATGAGANVLIGLLIVALLVGVLLVLPIGGADMPVVISLLNSCTGLAAAATGFVLSNHALIISGTLVGASGTILTQLMCKAMNRPLGNVLFGAVGAVKAGGGAPAAVGSARPTAVRDVSVEDTALLLANVGSLVIVPGYGMAVAQAQHAARELADLLGRKGVDVKYAIHPVAGRMPGHMNVLLAEANVPYDQLYDLEQINPDLERTDVALVVGANDVVNPAARHDTQSPIYGMPILDVDKSRHVIIVKRSLNPGFAGIDNELYYNPRTMMLFGDAKDVLSRLVAELKQS